MKNRVPTKYRTQVVLRVASQGALSQIIYIQMYRKTFVESQVPINLLRPCRPLAYGIQLNSSWPRQYRYFKPCYGSVPSFLELQPFLFFAPFPTCLVHFFTATQQDQRLSLSFTQYCVKNADNTSIKAVAVSLTQIHQDIPGAKPRLQVKGPWSYDVRNWNYSFT
jgi:hypothetical protein